MHQTIALLIGTSSAPEIRLPSHQPAAPRSLPLLLTATVILAATPLLLGWLTSALLH